FMAGTSTPAGAASGLVPVAPPAVPAAQPGSGAGQAKPHAVTAPASGSRAESSPHPSSGPGIDTQLATLATAAAQRRHRPAALGLAAVTGGYVAIALSFEGAWHLFGRRGITLFGSLIILDGFYLAWVCFVSGGIASPVRYLMVLHLIAVVLLASYRTGLKVALWDSLLTMVV